MGIDPPLLDRTIVVTGALGRLGPVWIEALCTAGARVVGVDMAAAELPPRLQPFADRVELVRGDVTVRDDLEAVAAQLTAPADGLVCSAGIDQPPDAAAQTRRIEDVALDDFRATLDVNLAGTFNAIQVFGAPMAAAGAGAIVTIGSLYASIAPDPGFYDHLPADPPFLKPAAYGASKAGVLSLTRYFARLWGPAGVRVNALSPGGVAGSQDDEFVRKYTARTALRRMAEEADLAGPLIFLLSDAARYLTGHELRLDGGFTA
jgi:NAD(P)-dependent dehydrogenase (short-subunit alcohol dehydrogenase family)